MTTMAGRAGRRGRECAANYALVACALGLAWALKSFYSRASFEDLLYQTVRQPGGATSEQTQLPTGLQVGTGVRVAATAKQFSQGNLNNTGNALDVAINGRGFFEVLMPDGSTAYTRDGSKTESKR